MVTCATALPTPASENTSPSMPSICGRTAAHDKASTSRRASFMDWPTVSRVITQAIASAITQPMPNPISVTLAFSINGMPPNTR